MQIIKNNLMEIVLTYLTNKTVINKYKTDAESAYNEWSKW
jgi:hypothetical protein